MSNLNIIISAHNEAEYVTLCIQSIRMFADVENLSVILIDNNSNDGLTEWALAQEDIAYIQNDEASMPYGKIINQICNMLSLQGDILLLDPHFLLTPACLSRMMDTLYENEETGAVGPISNCMYRYQKLEGISNYENAIAWSNQTADIKSKRVMALSQEAILIKGNTFTQLNGFDETIQNSMYTMLDYCFRMIENNFTLKVCQSALLWDSRNKYPAIYASKHDEQLLEAKWGMHYFNSAGNQTLIDMIHHKSDDSIHVLEIGCDCGATLLEIKNLFPYANVYGSELNECAARVASHFATVTVNNIEEYNLPYPSNMFDYIIFGDVLEHLHRPDKAIEYCKTLLKDTGHIIASIPNVMHISVVKDLLKGNFTYTETGLLDKTHIHFFTYNEIMKMFTNCNYDVTHITSVTVKISEEEKKLIGQLAGIYSTQPIMFETFQYVVCAGVK